MQANLKEIIDARVNCFDWLAYYVIDLVDRNSVKITFYTLENVQEIDCLKEEISLVEKLTGKKVLWSLQKDSSKYIITQRRIEKCLKVLKYKLLQIIYSFLKIVKLR